jgi:hypothetical protein
VEPHTLIEEIRRMIQEKDNIAPDKQALQYGGKYLESGRPLSHYNIQSEATLWLSCHHTADSPPRTVYVKISTTTITARMLKLIIYSGDSLHFIQRKVQDETGIPPDQQRLIRDGREILPSFDLDFSLYQSLGDDVTSFVELKHVPPSLEQSLADIHLYEDSESDDEEGEPARKRAKIESKVIACAHG